MADNKPNQVDVDMETVLVTLVTRTHLLHDSNALAAISKCMWDVKLGVLARMSCYGRTMVIVVVAVAAAATLLCCELCLSLFVIY